MTTSDLIEITDEHGQPTGERMTLDQANDQGRWHHTAHIVLYTSDGQILVQKRASGIVRYPSLIDITVGGVVYAEETPEMAIVRRVSEELGVQIEPENLHKLGTTKYNHQVKRYDKHVRVILHNYIAELPDANVSLRYMQNEVSWAGFISLKQAEQFITNGKLDHIGRLIPRPKYYKLFLDAITKKLHDS
ncbi:hypothetical protein A2707_02005 [Candidatus Saccharibacteria bacterium RIFCSPHIGHO2_01_FULL_45_15]|nr:MAG: hypothetical protein A2707_02005 [Candidatus Saccharibacteria bacterium RIFCSPHIGHO2_01_FULL_45_15]OGL27756.1 MAG: hypothetical protein A3C39_04185 [Candidatus Saccharibacteria bacterium RIFCSPHIGHO2_02_FULL_46_12]OGL31645.1 MAG: hypothetical protein A3E76_00835 [Candidatus Saccharibacteria bacterium RIFCSPHIGHO2_12_FULL_44_22]